jgi:CAAX prenyl protease-like protein
VAVYAVVDHPSCVLGGKKSAHNQQRGTRPKEYNETITMSRDDKPGPTRFLFGVGGISLGFLCASKLSGGGGQLSTILGLIAGFGVGIPFTYLSFGELLRKKFAQSAIYVRVVPFFVFLGITFCQKLNDHDAPYWFYVIKTLVGAWMVWEMRPFVSEMRWAVSWEAVVVGVGVCVMWIGINDWYPKFSEPGPVWNPFTIYGKGSAIAWMFVLVHLLGSTFVVPPLEEVFYRSFLYRYLVKLDFQAMPLNCFHALSFIVTSVIFGPGEHYQWLAGILCGMVFQWLVIRKNRLGDSMTAHAITNFLLGIWVIWKGDWKFW